MKIALTGATGFIGRHLVQALGATPLSAGSSAADVVIHTAGIVGSTNAPRERYFEVNIGGTTTAVRAAIAMGARRFVLLSTGGVYRPAGTLPEDRKLEGGRPVRLPGADGTSALHEDSAISPRGDYAESKWRAEEAALAFRQEIHVQILRLFFPYGPGQQNERLIPRLIGRIKLGEPIELAGGEGPLMNPIYIDDLVEMIGRLITIDEELVVNVAGPEVATLRTIAEHIGRIVDRPPQIVATAATGESWAASITRAVQLTGWEPRISLAEGLRRTASTIS